MELGTAQLLIGYKCIPADLKILSSLTILSTGTSADSLNNCGYIPKEAIRQYSNNVVSLKVKCIVQDSSRFTRDVEINYIEEQEPQTVFPDASMPYTWKN